MNRFLTAAAAIALLSGAALAAPSGTNNITITGNVADTCTLALTSASANASVSGATSTVTLGTSMADASTALPLAWTAQFNVSAMCNYSHNVGFKSTNGGLTTASSAVGFANEQEYTASLTGFGATKSFDTAVSGTTADNDAGRAPAVASSATLALAGSTGATPLLSGSYQDTLTVQVGANL